MASTYTRVNSPFIWRCFKDGEGKWKNKSTGYRKDNPGDVFQATTMAKKQGILERERKPHTKREQWDEWVDGWLQDRYGQRQSTTLTVYHRYWTRLRKWLLKGQVTAPAQVTFAHVITYKGMREKRGTGINTIIHELKFLGVVMGEAIRRGFATANPCLRMGFQRAARKEKMPWTVEEVAKVAAVIGTQPDWMQATFILGYYQAARLRQCEVPLRDIDLERPRISYGKSITGRPLTKGDKPFAQPIAKAALPLLRALVIKRRKEGFASLCDIPQIPSVHWRQFFVSLDLGHLCHHGLRTTWITRAALSRKISREEAKAFVNHGSTAVHEIYQRLNADDVAHVADALGLPDLSSPATPLKRRSGRGAKPCSAPAS